MLLDLNVRTENGAKALATTGNRVLDFFALGGAIRDMEFNKVISLLDNAILEDKQLAMRAMFYFRDIRGGQGQREPFRKQLKYLAECKPELLSPLVALIPEYGRWDDLLSLFGTELEPVAMAVIREQLLDDLASDNPSLCAKWMPSINASSKITKRLGRIVIKYLEINEKEYRQILTILRKRLDIVETKITKKNYVGINYEHVPSQAMSKYRTAFYTHDEAKFDRFLNRVKTGEAKINTATLYPQQLIHNLRNNTASNKVINTQWDNLPDYTEGRNENSIVVVDTSGSMYGTPIEVAVSLGIYIAERNKGAYHNKFITFSGSPTIEVLKGSNLKEKCDNLCKAKWGFNTNIEKVFDQILNYAVVYKVPQEEMVSKIYIVSDMQFDEATDDAKTPMKAIKRKFKDRGYKLPKLVFWNVASRDIQVPVKAKKGNVQLVSGYSPSILKQLMTDEFKTAEELMLEVLNSERYEKINPK